LRGVLQVREAHPARNMSASGSDAAAHLRAASLKEQGNAKFNAGDYREALALYEEALGVAPGWGPLHANKARCLYKLGEFPQAELSSRTAIYSGFANVKTYALSGMILVETRKLIEAESTAQLLENEAPAEAARVRAGIAQAIASGAKRCCPACCFFPLPPLPPPIRKSTREMTPDELQVNTRAGFVEKTVAHMFEALSNDTYPLEECEAIWGIEVPPELANSTTWRGEIPLHQLVYGSWVHILRVPPSYDPSRAAQPWACRNAVERAFFAGRIVALFELSVGSEGRASMNNYVVTLSKRGLQGIPWDAQMHRIMSGAEKIGFADGVQRAGA